MARTRQSLPLLLHSDVDLLVDSKENMVLVKLNFADSLHGPEITSRPDQSRFAADLRTLSLSTHRIPPYPICCISREGSVKLVSRLLTLASKDLLQLTLGKLTLGTMTVFKAEGASLTLASLPGVARAW